MHVVVEPPVGSAPPVRSCEIPAVSDPRHPDPGFNEGTQLLPQDVEAARSGRPEMALVLIESTVVGMAHAAGLELHVKAPFETRRLQRARIPNQRAGGSGRRVAKKMRSVPTRACCPSRKTPRRDEPRVRPRVASGHRDLYVARTPSLAERSRGPGRSRHGGAQPEKQQSRCPRAGLVADGEICSRHEGTWARQVTAVDRIFEQPGQKTRQLLLGANCPGDAIARSRFALRWRVSCNVSAPHAVPSTRSRLCARNVCYARLLGPLDRAVYESRL